jgi:Protein of unknown function (DUF2807).
MKTTVTLALTLALFTVCATSCAQPRQATDKFEVTDFTAIEASTVANIRIIQSNTTSVTAEGSEELLDILNVRMNDGTLILEMEDRYLKRYGKNASKLVISVSTPTLTRVDSEGVGNILIEGAFSTPELIIDSEGVGNFTTENLKCNFIKIDSEGVGNITLGGTTDRVEISSDGVGNVNAEKLRAKSASVSSNGVGNVSCYASEYLKVRSAGIGNVTYYGNPVETDLSKDGIGKIKTGK